MVSRFKTLRCIDMKIALVFDNALSFNTYVTTGGRMTDGSVTALGIVSWSATFRCFKLQTGDEVMVPTDKYVVVTNKG